MRFDTLMTPVSKLEPCGPDLDEAGDDVYLNYTLPAAARMPERFFDSDGMPFDGKTVNLKGEVKTIAGLLARSRDLRLLTLEARFQCLAGDVTGFAECLEAMAGLLDLFWPAVHPLGFDGDYTMRQNTIAALDDRTTIILPLQHMQLARDRRVGPVSLRDYLVTTNVIGARGKTLEIDTAGILDAIADETSSALVLAAHAGASAAAKALTRIRARFIETAGHEYAPSFDGVEEVLQQMRNLIETARPDLATSSDAAEAPVEAGPQIGGEAPEGASSQTSAPRLTGAAPTLVPDHAAARAALGALDRYFTSREPSSPSLVLIRQSQVLIGLPLSEALRILMPDMAERATIRLDGGLVLPLTSPQTSANAEVSAGVVVSRPRDPPSFPLGTRQEASDLLAGIEAFFRAVEPSSPIPLLLAKAKQFMNLNFSSILQDLLKPEAAKS